MTTEDGLLDLCTVCKKPFSPSHNFRAPGPTVRHPFFPVPLKQVIDEAKQEGAIEDATVTKFDLEQRDGTVQNPDILSVDLTVRVKPHLPQTIAFTITLKPEDESS